MSELEDAKTNLDIEIARVEARTIKPLEVDEVLGFLKKYIICD